jgi:hypothetical protein
LSSEKCHIAASAPNIENPHAWAETCIAEQVAGERIERVRLHA